MKYKKLTIWAFSLAICFAITLTAEACSSFFLNTKKDKVFAYNFDLPINNPQSYIFINKRNEKKTAYMPWKDKPVHWTSKYGSITFNNWSIDFPITGMNEKGLCISETTLRETEYPKKDLRPVIGTLQWIQYQLDTAATVEEAIENCSKIRISQYAFACDFLVSDKEGNAAVIEFIKGQPIIHTDWTLPVPVITNRNYNKSLKQLINFEFKSQNSNFAQNYYNLYMNLEYPSVGFARFILATNLIKEYQRGKIEKPIVNYAFFILRSIEQHFTGEVVTRWSIVHNPTNLSIKYKTEISPKIKEINFKDFDFTKNYIIDINKNFTNINEIKEDFSISKNNKIMSKALPKLKPYFKGLIPKQTNKNTDEIYNTWTKEMPNYIKNEYKNNE